MDYFVVVIVFSYAALLLFLIMLAFGKDICIVCINLKMVTEYYGRMMS